MQLHALVSPVKQKNAWKGTRLPGNPPATGCDLRVEHLRLGEGSYG